ncbi:MAG TPA: hypothetical protein VF483_06810 [Gemmatimonadaceae bacterium]
MKKLLAVVLSSLVLASCDRSRGMDDPIGARVDAAIPRIERVAKMKFKTKPRFELRSREQVRDFLLKKFNDATSAEDLRGQESAYKAFGLIPDTLNLRRFLLDLLTEQILGYYDPATKVLYVVRDAPSDLTGITVTHELVHALQDQYVNLDSIEKSHGNSDRQAAAQAVLEGQATWVQMQDMLNGADIATRIPGGWDQIRQQIRENQSSMPRFANAPMAIQESLIFPYLSGAEFVRRYETRHDARTPLARLPVSTEQVLSEEAFFGAKPDQPLSVTLPGKPATGEYEEVMGEFGTRLFLYQHSKDNRSAVDGATGWGGDRYRVVNIPKGRGLLWVTAWDTPVDAAQFVDALGQALVRRYATGGASMSAGGVRTYVGKGRTVVVTPREISGTNVVIMVDVPAGASTALVDAARIRIGRE